MKKWTIADGESPRVYLINDGSDAVGEIVYTDTRRPEDARLIAAAPDLLAALITIQDGLREILRTSADNDTADNIDNLLETIESAIAKAEGVTE